MKKLILFVGVLLISGYNLIAQSCLPEGISFESQAEIDSFQVNYPNCTEIEGDVTINGQDITNLYGLNQVTYIGGELFVGTYESGGNLVLTTLSGLESLTTVNGSVVIFQNFVLTSLTGLENLTSIGDDLIIYSNSVNSLTGLANLTTVGGSLIVERNYVLTSLTGLDNLSSIGGDISIGENDALISLTGLGNLNAASIVDLSIYDNPSLSACAVQSICNYLTAPNGVISVYNNLTGCNTPPEIANDCGITLPCLPFGDYYFTTQAEIDNFHTNYPECIVLQGNVEIVGNDITNLLGLEGITFVGSDLSIYHCDALNTLNGLSTLDSVGGDLFIEGNDSLINMEGLVSLNSVGRDIYIGVNELLHDLVGLDNLDSVGRDLDIVSNNKMDNFTGLASLSYIGRHFTIWEDTKLTGLTGLEGLEYIGGTLKIGGYYLGNQLLTSLTGLENLTHVGHFINITHNPALVSLTGLDNIDTASLSGIYIYDNASLSTCEVQSVCDYLASQDAAVDISNNADGCNNQEEVLAACAVGVDESSAGSRQSSVEIYPNPSTSLIFIDIEDSDPKFLISIFNLQGQQIIQQQVTGPRTSIDVSELNPGIYFVKVNDDNMLKVLKMIKQ